MEVLLENLLVQIQPLLEWYTFNLQTLQYWLMELFINNYTQVKSRAPGVMSSRWRKIWYWT